MISMKCCSISMKFDEVIISMYPWMYMKLEGRAKYLVSNLNNLIKEIPKSCIFGYFFMLRFLDHTLVIFVRVQEAHNSPCWIASKVGTVFTQKKRLLSSIVNCVMFISSTPLTLGNISHISRKRKSGGGDDPPQHLISHTSHTLASALKSANKSGRAKRKSIQFKSPLNSSGGVKSKNKVSSTW